MTGAGVRAGTMSPTQLQYSNPGKPASVIVGTSGSSEERVRPVTASALSLPDFRNGSATAMPENITGTAPDTTSVIAGVVPLYGTWVRSTPARALNSSITTCCG